MRLISKENCQPDIGVPSISRKRPILSTKCSFPCGSIKRIVMKNFMCHKNMSVALVPKVNFIIGANGSGKSAIMNAVTLGLGGKAANTSRSNSVHSFTQEGKTHSEIRITLANTQTSKNALRSPFRPCTYGDEITVVRRLSATGSAYMILSDRDKVMSRKANTVRKMCEHFDIQLDNPVCMLNQESSKSLMNVSRPSELFRFFSLAARLDRMAERYQKVKCNTDKMHNLNYERMQSANEVNSKLNGMRKLLRNKHNMELLRAKLKELMAEKPLSRLKAVIYELSACMSEKDKLISEMSRGDETIMKLKAKEKEIGEQVLVESENLESLKVEVETCRSAHLSSDDRLNEYRTKRTVILEKVKEFKSQLAFKEAEMRSVRTSCEDPGGSSVEDYDKKHEVLEVTVEKVRSRLSEEEGVVDSVRSNLNDLSFPSNQREVVINLTSRKRELASRIELLKQVQNDKTRRFGSMAPEIDAEITRRQRYFNHIPLGPIGTLLKVKRSEWSLALECCLGNQLANYVCFDYEDEKLLKRILDDVFATNRGGRLQVPGVIVAAGKSLTDYDLSKYRPKVSLPVVVEMLNFVDDRIGCVLVDQSQIDMTVLCDDRDKALNVISRGDALRAGIRRMFLQDGSELLPSISDNTFRMYSAGTSNCRYFTSVDSAAELNSTSGELALVEASLKMAEERMRVDKLQFEKKKSVLDGQLASANAAVQRSKTELTEAGRELTLLKSSRMKMSASRSSVEYTRRIVAAMDEDISKLTKLIELNEAKAQEFKETFLKENEEREELKVKLQEKCRLLLDAKRKIESLKSKSERLPSLMDAKKLELDGKQSLLEKLNDNVIELSGTVEQAKREAADCDIENLTRAREPQELDKLLAQTESRLMASESCVMKADMPNLEEELEKLQAYLDQINASLDNDKVIVKALDSGVNTRAVSFKVFQDSLSERCTLKFKKLIACRDFTGGLDIDHDKRQLHVTMVKKEDQISSRGKKERDRHNASNKIASIVDTRCLSGGERSFVSVCFLITLWEVIHQPFRFLDEFDVFMDQSNLSVMTMMLVKAAYECSDTQFIFISPQGISVDTKEDVSILRMPEPER